MSKLFVRCIPFDGVYRETVLVSLDNIVRINRHYSEESEDIIIDTNGNRYECWNEDDGSSKINTCLVKIGE